MFLLKNIRKSMEAKKAGMVYSENIAGDITDEFDLTDENITHNYIRTRGYNS